MTSRVFAIGEGLETNLGDSVLRRGLLRRLASDGPLHIYVGRAGAGYLAGLGLGANTVLYQSSFRWHLSCFASALVRRTEVFASPGEAIADRRSAPSRVALASISILARLRGGGVRQLGLGIRRPLGRWRWPLVASSKAAIDLSWRDEWSRDLLALGRVAPDWAFGESSSIERVAERPHLAVALRGDRPWPSDSQIAAIGAFASACELEVLPIAQVEADQGLAEHLQSHFGSGIVCWGDGDHLELEKRVRGAYASARAVVSDRVHALIIGATEYAAPIAWGATNAEKAARTLAAAGFDDIAVTDDDLAIGLTSKSMSTAFSSTAKTRERALAAAQQLDAEVARFTSARSAPKRLTVLHSMPAPDGLVTRYADHMAAAESPSTAVRFFSWRTALLGRYDVFHVHWPEYLLRGANVASRTAKALGVALLIFRLKLTRARVVRTLHNPEAHEGGSPIENLMVRLLDKQVDAYIALNPATPSPRTDALLVHIPHGHYIDRFAKHERSETISGRVCYFGLIREYKNVPRLISEFSGITDPGMSLEVVGKAQTSELAATIEAQAAPDDRIELRLSFVEDEELVGRVTRAQLVVLPYAEMHNSGVLIVALSLGVPVLAPRTAANSALRDEVGAEWLQLYDGEFRGTLILDALSSTAPSVRDGHRPDLSNRDWDQVSQLHRNVYSQVASRPTTHLVT